jgi:hypothetical protein
VIFIIIGAVLLHYSNTVREQVIDYTQCQSGTGAHTCADQIDNTKNFTFSSPTCTCKINFYLSDSFPKPVYVYYGLTNFYQNHRRYVNSRDDNQLLGNTVSASTLNTNCNPYGTDNATGKVIAPCGAIANSFFNDSYTLSYNNVDNSSDVVVPISNDNIAWTSDTDVKFGNYNFTNTVPPPNWVFLNGQSVSTIGGFKNQDFIVWMRTAALPNFRKLKGRVNHTGTFTNGITNGWYTLDIKYSKLISIYFLFYFVDLYQVWFIDFPVTGFGGQKSFVITTSTWLGGKNPFLGIAYLVIGCICIVLGIVFLIVHLMFGKK